MFGADLELNDPALEAALTELYRRRWLLETLQAEREQYEMARHLREAKAVDGLGEKEMILHPTLWADAIAQYGHGCWSDKGFRSWVRRKCPETAVKCGPSKTQIQCGFGSSGNRRFSKTYADSQP